MTIRELKKAIDNYLLTAKDYKDEIAKSNHFVRVIDDSNRTFRIRYMDNLGALHLVRIVDRNAKP